MNTEIDLKKFTDKLVSLGVSSTLIAEALIEQINIRCDKLEASLSEVDSSIDEYKATRL